MNYIHTVILIAAVTAFATARGGIVSETVEYKADGAVLEGTLVYDDAIEQPMPAVVIYHQWGGASAYEQKRAEMIAGLGYAAFVADIYGKGIRPETVEQKAGLSSKYKENRELMRERAKAAVDTVRERSEVDDGNIIAIGYCFGGTVALELARSGEEINGFVSFHGGLATPTPEDANNIQSPLLICHGADDPYVPAEEVDAFKKEMNDAGVKYQFIAYPGAVHSFTDWGADSDGARYNQAADEASWDAFKSFADEQFSTPIPDA